MGGSGSNFTPGGPSSGYNTCDSLTFDTILVSPAVAVVTSLRMGDLLPLRLVEGQTSDTVEAYTDQGVRAGSVNALRIQELIKCMKEKHAFVAEVIRIDGGVCKVCISHR